MNISIDRALKQTKYCLLNNLPSLMPGNGICPNCHKSIFVDYERMAGGMSKGYTAEQAASEHIKQCPHCMHIFEKRGGENG